MQSWLLKSWPLCDREDKHEHMSVISGDERDWDLTSMCVSDEYARQDDALSCHSTSSWGAQNCDLQNNQEYFAVPDHIRFLVQDQKLLGASRKQKRVIKKKLI